MTIGSSRRTFCKFGTEIARVAPSGTLCRTLRRMLQGSARCSKTSAMMTVDASLKNSAGASSIEHLSTSSYRLFARTAPSEGSRPFRCVAPALRRWVAQPPVPHPRSMTTPDNGPMNLRRLKLIPSPYATCVWPANAPNVNHILSTWSTVRTNDSGTPSILEKFSNAVHGAASSDSLQCTRCAGPVKSIDRKQSRDAMPSCGHDQHHVAEVLNERRPCWRAVSSRVVKQPGGSSRPSVEVERLPG